MLRIFLKVINETMNESMQVEISKKNIQYTRLSMKRDKSLGHDGFIMELILGYYKLLKSDLLKMVQEYKKRGKILGVVNSTFLHIIPKKKK